MTILSSSNDTRLFQVEYDILIDTNVLDPEGFYPDPDPTLQVIPDLDLT
jgi:hypothetical protein